MIQTNKQTNKKKIKKIKNQKSKSKNYNKTITIKKE
jgi:hypothetical protein